MHHPVHHHLSSARKSETSNTTRMSSTPHALHVHNTGSKTPQQQQSLSDKNRSFIGSSNNSASKGGSRIKREHTEQEVEKEEELLRRRAEKLEEDIARLKEKKFRLYLKNYEDQLRDSSQKELELFTKGLYNDLQTKINQLVEEKDQKVNDCLLYQKELKEKIVALQRIANELQQKVEDINASYAQCLKELQSEYDNTVNTEKQRLENSIRKQLQTVASNANLNQIEL